jgi:hypothetical protein
VIERRRADRARDPRRHEQRRHAQPELLEVVLLVVVVGRLGRGRHHVIVEAAVLVVEHHEQGRLPQRRIAPQRVVDVGDQVLAAHDVVRRMVVVRARAEIVGLDQREAREVGLGPRRAPAKSS